MTIHGLTSIGVENKHKIWYNLFGENHPEREEYLYWAVKYK